MATISTIAAHSPDCYQFTGLRRAVVTRRANLGDCVEPVAVIKRLMSPRYLRYPACVIPIGRRSRPEPSAADLAVDISRQVLDRLPSLDTNDVGAVIYCHAVPDEKTAESTVGRLQFELGLRRANPFSISQAHNTSLLIGLDIALGLVDGPEAAPNVLLVASDKLLFGGPATRSRHLMFGDVAAAAVISRDTGPGWRVERVVLSYFATDCAAMSAWPSECIQAFILFGAQFLQQTLREMGLNSGDLHCAFSTMPDSRFAAELHRVAGLPAPYEHNLSKLRRERASSPDLLVALAALSLSVPMYRKVLAWTCGNNGEVACCVLTRT